MNQNNVRVRVDLSTGELEIEGSVDFVESWWERLWPEVKRIVPQGSPLERSPAKQPPSRSGGGSMELPEEFGEYFSQYRSDITDVDKIMVAASYVQGKEQDKSFLTKAANQLLLEQNIKVANASECVRRLIQTRRAFAVSDGKYRISVNGFEHLRSLLAEA